MLFVKLIDSRLWKYKNIMFYFYFDLLNYLVISFHGIRSPIRDWHTKLTRVLCLQAQHTTVTFWVGDRGRKDGSPFTFPPLISVSLLHPLHFSLCLPPFLLLSELPFLIRWFAGAEDTGVGCVWEQWFSLTVS